jgi:hypothetical protein
MAHLNSLISNLWKQSKLLRVAVYVRLFVFLSVFIVYMHEELIEFSGPLTFLLFIFGWVGIPGGVALFFIAIFSILFFPVNVLILLNRRKRGWDEINKGFFSMTLILLLNGVLVAVEYPMLAEIFSIGF